MAYPNSDAGRERQSSRAAIFVDYENLYLTLNEASTRRGDPDEHISEMIEALQKSLRQERDVRTAVSRAYADFTAFASHGETIQRLYLQGVEPRFVPCSLQANAVEIQLTVDAMDLLHHRPDIETFVLLTGRRTYLPLVQHVKRYGRGVLVVALEEPAALEQVQHMEGEWFFDAHDLLSTAARQSPGGRTVTSGNGVAPRRKTVEYRAIEDLVLVRAVELIERHFGQY
ncbi:MAG: NYN domain-containing protein, partial [Rhodothermales bacterium]